jgi:methylated-DNA-[protein]-cysteine S-methyltransferase
MDKERVTVFDSAIGWMAAAWLDTRVMGMTFGHSSPIVALANLRSGVDEPSSPDRFMKRLVTRLRGVAKGRCGDAFDDVEIDTAGMTAFQQSVVKHCRRIPVGETMSYGELAQRAGHARAARAVGRVMSCNRFPLIVPCHRVVSSNSLGGFSSPNGLKMKRRLLDAEAAHSTKRIGV